MQVAYLGNPEMECDVIVVGYGGAGATAAIAAHDRGAKVVVIEKEPVGGGNTRVSGGSFIAPPEARHFEAAVRYIDHLNAGMTEREITEALVRNALETNDWIATLGGEAVAFMPFTQGKESYPRPPIGPNFSNIPGGEHLTRYAVGGDLSIVAGKRLWDLLSANVEKRGIDVFTSTPAHELVLDGHGAVVGVMARREGKNFHFRARKSVILTTGGFEFNEAMKAAFLPCYPIHASGNPCNTGDGIVLAQKAGAALWHMTAAAGYYGFKHADYPAAFMIRYCGPAFVHVNREGGRFCNETGRDYHDMWRDFSRVDSDEHTHRIGYPDIPAYGIFDEATCRRGSLYRTPTGYNGTQYEWSVDNAEEIEKGWIKKGDTLAELAGKIGVDAQSLSGTIARYNTACGAGFDAEFGRSTKTLAAIDKPPFYAIELWPSMLNTQGGPRRDKEARVLDYTGRPIPGLYAAGELGTVWGFVYGGGGNITDCLAFGRIAGRNAAAAKDR